MVYYNIDDVMNVSLNVLKSLRVKRKIERKKDKERENNGVVCTHSPLLMIMRIN